MSAVATSVTEPVPSTGGRHTSRNVDRLRKRLDLRAASLELGFGWPTDDEVVDHWCQQTGVRPGPADDITVETIEQLFKAGAKPIPPPGFDEWPENDKILAHLASIGGGGIFARNVAELAAQIDGRLGKVRREVRRLRQRSCWCHWGQHTISETDRIAFVHGMGGEQRQTREIACGDCFDHVAAQQLVEVRASIDTGNYHESWKSATDDQVRDQWVTPHLLHNGAVFHGDRLRNRRPITKPCRRCGRKVTHAQGAGQPRRVYLDAEQRRALLEEAERYECAYIESPYQYIVICSERCRSRLRSAERAREPEARDCATCGESFTPARRDARFCSGACRQFAYRQRKAAAS